MGELKAHYRRYKVGCTKVVAHNNVRIGGVCGVGMASMRWKGTQRKQRARSEYEQRLGADVDRVVTIARERWREQKDDLME